MARSSARLAARTLLVLLVLPRGLARAEFGDVHRVCDGTAYTLEKGEFTVGVLGPLQIGVTDEVTVVTHPILHLFLTPNLLIRGKVLDRGAALALNLGYIQTFLDPKKLDFPGTVAFFPTLTVPLSRSVALSGQTGYQLNVSPVQHGLSFGGGVAILASRADLVNLQVQGEYFRETGAQRPVVLLVYTHAFYRFRIRAGVAVGRFPIQVGSASTRIKNLPAYPVVDVMWWL